MKSGKVTVLGGGQGAHAAAVDLTSRGFDVVMWEHPAYAGRLSKTFETSILTATGAISGDFRIKSATTDLAKAAGHADILLIPVPSTAHEAIFQLLVPHLRRDHVVVLMPGNFGSLELRYLLQKRDIDQGIVVGETNTLPYGCRLDREGRIHILIRASNFMAGAFPARDSEKLAAALKSIYPTARMALSAVEAALNNTNYPIHPAGSILNAGAIEMSFMEKKDYFLYTQGISHSVAQVIARVDFERLRLVEALGYERITLMDHACNLGYEAHHLTSAAGPFGLQDRYITEDVPFGLVPMSFIGGTLGVDVPTIDALIHLAGVLNDIDYVEAGRNAARLGLAGLSAAELRGYLTS